ncbi:RNA polymerase sigma factor [Anaerohalosphaera lusitana]|uniref:RNA polymerase sigma factor n=1 Tax=Anaerohalosphaera lusitana TaxID=1936003 RepID=A0A1U9NJS5_9BACT|nr:sigma-70 family RNA polymerase sigma factor [Anaerohalosphaera lusitana]AQT68065.1 RNA polymerase sigma factor [Anaerohalosphaera lusitana]
MENRFDKSHDVNKLFMGYVLSSQKDIYVYILSLVICKEDADDILQDTLALMWSKFDEFEPGTNFVGWGKTIARYKVMDFLRKNKRSRLHYDSDVLKIIEAKVPESDVFSDRKDAMQNCLKKLPDKDIDVLKMRYSHGMTFKQMALKFGISKQSAYRKVSRIHALLVKCINQVLSSGPSYGS